MSASYQAKWRAVSKRRHWDQKAKARAARARRRADPYWEALYEEGRRTTREIQNDTAGD